MYQIGREILMPPDIKLERGMWGTLKKVDYLFWIGNEALYIQDMKNSQLSRIEYERDSKGEVPYAPRFMSIWDNALHYGEQLSRIMKGKRFQKPIICLALPEDLNLVDKKAWKDFAEYAGARGKVLLCSQGTLMQRGSQNLITVTETCRSYSYTWFKYDQKIKRIYGDIHENSYEDFLKKLHELCPEYERGKIPVYYSAVEHGTVPKGIGEAVVLEDIIKVVDSFSVQTDTLKNNIACMN